MSHSRARRTRSRYDASNERPYYLQEVNKEPSFLDHVLCFGEGLRDTIDRSLGLYRYEEETDASGLTSFGEEEDSRNDDTDEVSLRYEKPTRPMKMKEARVDPEGGYLQQNLRNIYERQQTKNKGNSASGGVESDDSSLKSLDDCSIGTSNSFESESYRGNYYSNLECPSYQKKRPTTSLKPASALKKSQMKNNKKQTFQRIKAVSFEEPEEKKQVKWIDQIAADFDPYLFQIRRAYAKQISNIRVGLDEHDVIMEKMMKENGR
ncbi:hypothetical protein ACHAWT_000809 [Skeletonema menzelii]|mmetsp:Transcript_28843/g.46765  ORF Transcript_28843/g.46765 Transcript_28843/m.46765 type:complete len:264 (-) Transcript_28843:76-867(-)